MSRKTLIVALVLMAVVNIVLIRAQMRLGYDPEAKVKEPEEKYIFQTEYKGGTQIVFDHEMHAEGYGLECVECHHLESCRHCHGKKPEQADIERSMVAIHKVCLGCHHEMEVGPQKCEECHKQ
ncbi:MAG: cytochrome c3 family protein [Gemmatimonadota bacterium]|nr:cytochrome c3 family protein [Gemmatimonadota bacterium]